MDSMFSLTGRVAVVSGAAQGLGRLKLADNRQAGADILLSALDLPLRTIAENAGVDGSVIVRDVRREKGNFGYDADADKFVDMFEAGIVDPTKVVRSALENAVSVAGLLLTTECLIASAPDDDGADDGAGMDEDY